MTHEKLSRLRRDQAGVVSRRQVLAAGYDDNDIERWIRRRQWARVHQGVYVDHTGELSWLQAAWAAILFSWPAALSHDSALVPTGSDRVALLQPRGPGEVIHVAIDHSRRGVELRGIHLHRVPRLDEKTLWNVGPPRMRLEEAVLLAAGSRDRPTDALAVVADACQSGRTTPARLIATLGSRRRMRHGAWLRSALQDVAQGVRSVLEHGYLTRVERPHGIPRARRQAPGGVEGAGSVYRDVEYPAYRTIVELDGRLGHDETHDRWADLDRDVDAQVNGSTTLRLSWPQVFASPCRTARAVARVLSAHGWEGGARPCGPDCALAEGPRRLVPAIFPETWPDVPRVMCPAAQHAPHLPRSSSLRGASDPATDPLRPAQTRRPHGRTGRHMLDRPSRLVDVHRNWTYFFGYLPGAPEQAVR